MTIQEQIASDPNITPAFRAAVRPTNFRAALDARPDVVERVLEDVQPDDGEEPERWDGLS